MSKNQSVEFFQRLVNERFQIFSQALADLIQKIVGDNRQAKIAAAQRLKDATDQLKNVMSSSDWPDWLRRLSSDVDTYLAHANSNTDVVHRLMSRLLASHLQIQSHEWSFGDSASNAIDFNAIFQQALADSRIPQLFEQLISQLEQIIVSDEIDSRKAQESLERLIATLRKNAKSDYLSSRGAWEFSRSYLKNVLKHVATEAPVLKHLVKPLFTTIEEMDVEWGKVHNELKEKIAVLGIESDMPLLEYKEKAVLLLSGPEEKPK